MPRLRSLFANFSGAPRTRPGSRPRGSPIVHPRARTRLSTALVPHDTVLFVTVTSIGIANRPSCPAMISIVAGRASLHVTGEVHRRSPVEDTMWLQSYSLGRLPAIPFVHFRSACGCLSNAFCASRHPLIDHNVCVRFAPRFALPSYARTHDLNGKRSSVQHPPASEFVLHPAAPACVRVGDHVRQRKT